MKKSAIVIAVLILVITGAFLLARQKDQANSAADATGDSTKQPSFDKQQLSLTDPNSLWVIADKHRPLEPKQYTPSDLVVPEIPLRLTAKDDEMKLRKEAAAALKQLAADAQKDNLKLMVSSGYRSYAFQVNLYNRYVQQQGRATADSQSARPGYSEHQTGLAVDLEPADRSCEIEACFGQTPEGKWVAANAYKYGYVLRYQEGRQGVTGYIYEPWHIRYVGKALAAEVHRQGNPTLEEFFGLGAAPDYL